MEKNIKDNVELRNSEQVLPTEMLIDAVMNNSPFIVEARLLLNGGYATHFLYSKNNRLYNEGIDGENSLISKKNFFTFYKDCFWIIDQVV